MLFYKLLGSGKGRGFSPFPDWSTYAMLQVWESEKAADQFFADHALAKKYQSKTDELWTVYMRSIMAKGKWSGGNPFEPSTKLDVENKFIAVITRATIRVNRLWQFWRYVPTSEEPLTSSEGLIYTKGIGEVPILQMATFSIWQDLHSVQQFAYRSKEHHTAIEKTRQLDWYKEELFSRFQPYRSVGTWGGANPLPLLS